MFSMNKVSALHIIPDYKYRIRLNLSSLVNTTAIQYISPHMLEKVDKSEYQHEDIDTKKGTSEVDSDDVGEVEESDDE